MTLFPIERVTLESWCAGHAAWFHAAKEPHALVLREPAGTRAVDGTGCAVSLDDLCARVPGLRALLSDA